MGVSLCQDQRKESALATVRNIHSASHTMIEFERQSSDAGTLRVGEMGVGGSLFAAHYDTGGWLFKE